MKKIAFSLLSVIALATMAQADSLKGGGYGACISADLFDQFTTATVKKDERAFQYLLKHGCIIPKSGIPVSVLDRTWTGTAKVRAYVGGETVILWTNIENIQK